MADTAIDIIAFMMAILVRSDIRQFLGFVGGKLAPAQIKGRKKTPRGRVAANRSNPV